MKRKDITINSYLQVFGFSPIAWWLHLGSSIRGHILVCGGLSNDSIHYLATLCEKLYIFDCENFSATSYNNDDIKIIDADTVGDFKYNAIIIDRLNGEHILPDINIITLLKNNLSEDGAMCLFERNDYSLGSKKTNYLLKLVNLLTDIRLIKLNNMLNNSIITKFNTITYEENPYESFKEGNYFSNKNNFKFKEKIKIKLLNSRFSRSLANSNIWVIRKSNKYKNLIELIIENLKQKEYMIDCFDLDYSIIYYKYGKLIISLKDSIKNKRFIVVIALDKEAIRQRSNEKKTLEYLREIHDVKKYVIDEYYEENILGFKCYVMKEYQGITVDVFTRKLEFMTKNSFDVLLTITRSTINENFNILERSCLVDNYFSKLLLRLPAYSNSLLKIKKYILDGFDKYDMPSVCMHGDSKLENYVLDENNSVIGVIDWELSEIKGFPLIDLFYLIVYNHQIEYKLEFEQVFIDLLDNKLHTYELNMINYYCQTLSINNDKVFMLKIMFFIHHFAYRFLIGVESDTYDLFDSCLIKINKKIETGEY